MFYFIIFQHVSFFTYLSSDFKKKMCYRSWSMGRVLWLAQSAHSIRYQQITLIFLTHKLNSLMLKCVMDYLCLKSSRHYHQCDVLIVLSIVLKSSSFFPVHSSPCLAFSALSNLNGILGSEENLIEKYHNHKKKSKNLCILSTVLCCQFFSPCSQERDFKFSISSVTPFKSSRPEEGRKISYTLSDWYTNDLIFLQVQLIDQICIILQNYKLKSVTQPPS